MSKRTGNEGLRLAQAHFNRMDMLGTAPTANERLALSTLLRTLDAGIGMSRFHALYPIMGGVAATQALDAMGAFDITWAGTITHSSDGAQGNKTTGYGDTGYIPDPEMDVNNAHLAYYSEGGTFPASSAAVWGTGQGSFIGMGWLSGGTEEAGALATGGSTQYVPSGPATTHDGHHIVATNGSRSQSYYRDGAKINSSVTATGATALTYPMFLMAWNNLGTAAILSDKVIKLASIGGQLSAAEALVFSDANLAYQTTLGRQV